MSEQSPLPPTPEPPGSNSSGGGRHRTASGLQRRFVDTLGWLITGIWSVSFILDAAVKTYDPPVSIHALMMVVAGAAFGSTLIKRAGEGE